MTKLTSESILAAATDRLEQFGLTGLSMRGIATDLEVQPGALYWHFPNKQSLLAALADQVIAACNPNEGDDPVAAALRLRTALMAVPDGAELVASAIALGAGGAPAIELLQRACREHDRAETLAATALHLVLGEVMHEQQRAQAKRLGVELGVESVSANEETLRRGLEALFRTT